MHSIYTLCYTPVGWNFLIDSLVLSLKITFEMVANIGPIHEYTSEILEVRAEHQPSVPQATAVNTSHLPYLPMATYMQTPADIRHA